MLRVRCPYCGYEFKTKTIKRVRCYNCQRTFKVYYKEKKNGKWVLNHRVVRIESGTFSELMRRINKEIYGR